MSNTNVATPPQSGGDILQTFQLTQEGIKEKSSPDYGKLISKKIWNTTQFNFAGYYTQRNARFIKNRNYGNGRINVQAMFQDRFRFNGKQNYIALNWQTLQLVNRIISGLVGRWMQRNERIQVKAIDNLSQTQKQEEYDQLEFLLYNLQQIEQLQQASGVQLIPQDSFIPADKEQLNLWQAQMQKLPEEILFETGCNDVLTSNGWFDVLKEKMLHDAAETLLVGTYTYMDNNGVIHVRKCKPENMIYAWSEHDDFRDASWLGEAPTLKISEIRRNWGKEFNPNNPLALTEKEIWEKVIPFCKEYQYQSNIAWNDTWYTAFLRPYDEWNTRSIQFELRSPDSEPYTVTKTKSTGSTYTEKGYPTTQSGKRREKPLEGQNIIGDTNWNIYRGVYLPDCDILLEWGLKDNMIRPQDPKEIGNAEFSYSFYMPQNYLMRNLAIPEKIEAAIDGMILALLKMQQLVARMRPTGAAINMDALENIDYGLGDAENKAVDHKKVYDQTGDIYYRGRDAEGNPIPVPIQELANSGFLGQMDGLIKNYQFYYQTLKDELGEDPNLISAALQPRVTGQNVEASQLQSEYATDYIYRAYSECMKMTARKVSCLLNDSVTYGSKAYRNIINQQDIDKRIFSTDIRLLPTQMQVQKFEAMMNQAIAAKPELISFLDPFQLIRVAQEDVKLAEALFRQAQKHLILYETQTAQQNQQATFEAQLQSAKVAEEEKRKTKQMEIEGDVKKGQQTALAQNQTAVLNLVATLLKPVGETGSAGNIPAELKPLVSAVIDNVMVGAVASSEEQKMAIQQQIQQARMQQEQEMQEQMMQQQQQSEPQPQIAA